MELHPAPWEIHWLTRPAWKRWPSPSYAFTHFATVSEPSLGSTVEVDFFKLLNYLFLNVLWMGNQQEMKFLFIFFSADFFLGKRGRFRGKRIVFEANGPFLRQTRRTIFLTFPILSPRSYTSSHTPLETGAIYVKSGTVYNHTNHVTRPELIRKKSGKRRSFEESPTPWGRLWLLHILRQ